MSTLVDSIAFAEVKRERARQDAKWGPQDHSEIEWMSVLTEEVGEAAQAANNCNWHPTAEWLEQFRTELIHVAAVAIAAIQCIDRNEA